MHVELSEDQKIKVRDSKGLYQVMRQILLLVVFIVIYRKAKITENIL